MYLADRRKHQRKVAGAPDPTYARFAGPSSYSRGIPARAVVYGCRLTHPDFTVRAAGPEDAAAILDLWHQERSSHASTADRVEDIQQLLAEAPDSVRVATDGDGALLGALIAAWDGWRGNMYRLAVLRAHRRRGIGLALVRAGEAHLHGLGARRITALVAYDDELAGSFWDAAGYPRDREIGRRVRNL